MRVNTINLQIVRNLGNFESIRIGAEWTPDSNQTLADAMAAGMAELNATADMLTGKKNAPAAAAAPAAPAAAAKPEPKAEAAAQAAAPAAEQPAAKAESQPDAFESMNAERENDTREMLTLANAKKFNSVIGRIMAGVDIVKVCDYFRFDADALAIIRAAKTNTRVTLAFGDPAFSALIKAIEEQKDITNICNCIQLADQNASNAWELACKMNVIK